MNFSETCIAHVTRRPGAGRTIGPRPAPRAFTLTELLIVVVVIGIIAWAVVTNMAPAATVTGLSRAADVLGADIQFCQANCVNYPGNPSEIVFNGNGAGYYVAAVSNPGTPMTNPANGRPYQVTFGDASNGAFSGIASISTTGLPENTLQFNQYGVPQGLTGNATITLTSAAKHVTLTVAAGTGEVAIGNAG